MGSLLLNMKLSGALLASVATAQGVGRGLFGPSSDGKNPYSEYGIKCKENKHCWAQAMIGFDFEDKPNKLPQGWRPGNLECDTENQVCVCKKGFLDENDDPRDGCEMKINDNAKCGGFGTCGKGSI